jgi:hypothetical protein
LFLPSQKNKPSSVPSIDGLLFSVMVGTIDGLLFSVMVGTIDGLLFSVMIGAIDGLLFSVMVGTIDGLPSIDATITENNKPSIVPTITGIELQTESFTGLYHAAQHLALQKKNTFISLTITISLIPYIFYWC